MSDARQMVWLSRHAVGTCTLCGRKWDHFQGMGGLVPRANADPDGPGLCVIGICNECMEVIRRVSVDDIRQKYREISATKLKNQGEADETWGPESNLQKQRDPLKNLGENPTVEQVREAARKAASESVDRHMRQLGDLDIIAFPRSKLKARVESLKKLREIEKEARQNVDRLWREYKDQPDLLEVYLPSAERMLEMVSQAVDAMIEGVLT